MTDVHPLQEWGISAGVPAGWTVAQKNGFYPSTGYGWRVGSSGFVRQDGADQGYAITVMTEGASNQRTGIRLTEEVARRAAAALTVGPAEARPIDRAKCVLTSGGESWAGVAARLGLPSSRAGELRTTAGGNASPLSGQQACSPDIPGEPVSSASAVNGRYRAVATDLDCDGARRPPLVWPRRGGRHAVGRAQRPALPLAVDERQRRLHPDPRGLQRRRLRRRALVRSRARAPDSVWIGGGSTRSVAVSVNGLGYVPRSGDFDGDGRDDVLWYRPGSGGDSVWYGRAADGAFDAEPVTVNGTYEPVVGDLDGDTADDIYWYARGSGGESLWRGQVGVRTFSPVGARSVAGAYRPVAVDGDGDGADEITWYAPGSAPDSRWSGLPSSPTITALTINGDYLPVAGDFDQDGRGDIAWYGPGGRPESMWWGRADGGVTADVMRRA